MASHVGQTKHPMVLYTRLVARMSTPRVLYTRLVARMEYLEMGRSIGWAMGPLPHSTHNKG